MTVDETSASADALRLKEWAEARGVRFLRLSFVDNGGVLRTQAVSVRRIAEIATDGLGVVSGTQAVSADGEGIADGLPIGAIGQVWLLPVPGTARQLPWDPHHASVMCRFIDREGAPWAYCPRHALERAVANLAATGLRLEAAFEHEFMLLRRNGAALEHFEESGYASAHGLDHAAPILDAICEALEDQGVPVRGMLKEAGLSQFEIETEHGDVFTAADRFAIVRETISAVAAESGLVGTCLPLVFGAEAGNGWHCHFSLWRGEENLTGRGDALGEEANSFVAGIHAHLPALLALTTPTDNSFRRLRPGAWCGVFRAWGYDHKEAPLRVPTERHHAPTNVELKSVDATTNPFLALTGIIAAGLDGVRRQLELPPPIDRDPASMSEEERAAGGITPLPASLEDALQELEADAVLAEALGPELLAAWVAVKRKENSTFGPMEDTEQVRRMAEFW